MSTSWPWHPSVSLLLGPKYSSYHLCRLLGQIGWHASTLELGISPLCLQICFCINTSFGTPSGTNTINKIEMATSELDANNVIGVTEADLKEEQKQAVERAMEEYR